MPGAGVLYSDQLLYGIYAMHICSTLLSGQSHYYSDNGTGPARSWDFLFTADVRGSFHCGCRSCRNYADPRNHRSFQNSCSNRGRKRTERCLRRYLEAAWRTDGRFPVFCEIRRAGRCEPLLRLRGAAFCRTVFF